MKNFLTFLKQFAFVIEVFIYSIFFSTSLHASPTSWECKKDRSYVIQEREFVDENDRLKKFPTKFLSNLDAKTEVIRVTYDLDKGIATINGNSAKVTGFPKKNKSFKEIPLQSVVISSFMEKGVEDFTTLYEKDSKEIGKRIDGYSNNEMKKNNFLLNIRLNNANFLSTEFNEILKVQYKTKRHIPTETLDIEEFIEISKGKCRLLLGEN